jgi:cephalosporin hydroxylase
MVTTGQFLVVEDTNINGHPVLMDWMGGPGPMEALTPWLKAHPEFESDVLAERMMLTFYPGGWLRRIA